MTIDTMISQLDSSVAEIRALLERARDLGISPCSSDAVYAAKQVRARLKELRLEIYCAVNEQEIRRAAALEREVMR